jgi:hypothetical protein
MKFFDAPSQRVAMDYSASLLKGGYRVCRQQSPAQSIACGPPYLLGKDGIHDENISSFAFRPCVDCDATGAYPDARGPSRPMRPLRQLDLEFAQFRLSLQLLVQTRNAARAFKDASVVRSADRN